MDPTPRKPASVHWMNDVDDRIRWPDVVCHMITAELLGIPLDWFNGQELMTLIVSWASRNGVASELKYGSCFCDYGDVMDFLEHHGSPEYGEAGPPDDT